MSLLVSGRNGNRLSVGLRRIIDCGDGGGVGVVGQQRVFEVRVRATAAAAEAGQAQYGGPFGLVRHRRRLRCGCGRWRWGRRRSVEIHIAHGSGTVDSSGVVDGSAVVVISLAARPHANYFTWKKEKVRQNSYFPGRSMRK